MPVVTITPWNVPIAIPAWTIAPGDMRVPGRAGAWAQVRDRLDRLLACREAHFGYGTRLAAYQAIDDYVDDRVRHFPAQRQKLRAIKTSASGQWP